MVFVKILRSEKWIGILTTPATNLISIYEVEGTSCASAKDFIKQRFTDILKINPWLCSRLVKCKVDGVKDLYLSYSEEVLDPSQYISFQVNDAVFQLKTISEAWGSLTGSVKIGNECINKNEKLCNLQVIENSAQTKLAVMFSLSHNLGDGHTCYNIWKMLDMNEQVRKLEVERILNYEDRVKSETSITPLMDMPFWGEMWRVFKRGAGRRFGGKASPVTYAYKLNDEAIAARKALYNKGETFVSTHDIICTEFFPLCEGGMMFAMNLRGRMSDVNTDRAGNYEVMCPMNISKGENPSDFRANWNKVLKKEVAAEEVSNVSMSISWTTFYHQVELPGAKHVLHLPIYHEKDMIYRVLSVPLTAELTSIIFKMNSEETGIVIFAYSDVFNEEFLDNCELFEKKIVL